jgi:S1-C subfamily serine protease
VGSFSELSGYINTKRPNDKVNVTLIREGNTKIVPVVLVKNDLIKTELKGIEIENLDAQDKKKFRIDYGVKISDVINERLLPYKEELVGSIILNVDNEAATDVETVSRLLNNKDENQGISLRIITKSGQVTRIII